MSDALEDREDKRPRLGDEAARLSQQRELLVQSMLKYFPFDFWAKTPDGTCFLQSQHSIEMWGDVRGVPFDDSHVDPATLAQWAATNRRVLSGEVVQSEVRFATPDGQVRDFYQIVTPVADGGTVQGILGINIDITDRMRAVEALRASDERFRLAFDEGPLAMLIGDMEGTILQANRAMCRMSGFTVEELVGKHVLKITCPEDRDTTVDRIARLQAGDINDYTVEKRYLRKDGTPIWVRVTLARPNDCHGKMDYVLVMIEDIGQRKRAEQLLHAQRDLAVALGNCTTTAEALAACLDAAIAVSGMECGAFYLVDERGALDIAVHRGLSDEFARAVAHFDVDTPQGRDVRTGQPSYLRVQEHPSQMTEVAARDGHRVAAILPTSHEGRLVACLVLSSRVMEEIPGSARDALEAICANVGSVLVRIEAQEAAQKDRKMLRQMLDAYERHRQLAAYEIHDGVAQPLSAALMTIEAAVQQLGITATGVAGDQFSGGLELLRDSMLESRRLMSGLRPQILDDFGVVAAVEHLVREGRVTGDVEIEWTHQVQFNRLAPPLETAIFRIFQEGMANALHHSRSPRVRMALVQDGGRVRVEIEDWGVGFDVRGVPPSRFGLRGISERARLFGGTASIQSMPGRGTQILVELPVVETVAGSV
jgi:PAS domain S-box-containing protein